MKAAIISIGNELLLGKTINTNMAYLGAELAKLGIPVELCLTIKDEPSEIKEALGITWGKYDLVISTGGLGPTEDDLSKAAIAEFFGQEMRFDDEVWEHVQNMFSRRNMPTPELNRNQALVPEAFTALKNERGTAPGLCYAHEGKLFFAFQGVPLEMKYIFETHAKDIILAKYPQLQPVYQRTIHTHGISESKLAGLFTWSDVPQGVNLAWLPQTGRVDMRFYGVDKEKVDATVAKATKTLAPYVWGYDNESPATALYKLMTAKKATLATAESCTGGWLGKMLTDIAGASEFYLGGVNSYSNELKVSALKVREDTLKQYGAVSEECAREMVSGVKALTGASHAISITGIAGPGGGTKDKEVGTVFFGFMAGDCTWYAKQLFLGDRDSIRRKATEFAILEMLRYLQGRVG